MAGTQWVPTDGLRQCCSLAGVLMRERSVRLAAASPSGLGDTGSVAVAAACGLEAIGDNCSRQSQCFEGRRDPWIAVPCSSFRPKALTSDRRRSISAVKARDLLMNRRKVLVVDDDPGMQEVLASILATENVVIHAAVDGKEALQETLAWKPDLILLDVGLPKLNGLTLCKAIRAGKETRNIPIIIVTSFTARGRLEECMEAGADDFIGKPFRMEDLLIRVRAMFKTAHVTDHVERLNQYILAVRDLRERVDGNLKP